MGLAVVDKNTVAISASDVMLSFAAFPVEIPGEVKFPLDSYTSCKEALDLIFFN